MNSLFDYPNTFAWFCLVSRFSDNAVASWLPAKGLCLPSGSASATKKLAEKKEDDMDDLFGDDDGDAEAAAAAAKAAKE